MNLHNPGARSSLPGSCKRAALVSDSRTIDGARGEQNHGFRSLPPGSDLSGAHHRPGIFLLHDGDVMDAAKRSWKRAYHVRTAEAMELMSLRATFCLTCSMVHWRGFLSGRHLRMDVPCRKRPPAK